ncbi:MAG: ABC transporter ATP-binding protein [Bacteroidaceae bacterium]|nr:ABC transporter ATP-binding protein [Bacteroidaceae bacterium]
MKLELSNIKKSFGDKVALDVDNYIVNEGEVIGLVGNNGAGKTTMFRVILDLIKPDCGVVSIDGTNPAESEDWKEFTGAYVDSGFLIDYLTPDEYFSFIAKITSMSKDELDERLKSFEGFMNGEVLGQNTLIRNLSMGNKQKVGIIAAMLTNPKLLILDEPFNFLDPTSQLAMKHVIENYNKATGATVIVSSHNLTHTIDICTRVTLLEHGKVIKDYDKSTHADLTHEIENYFIENVKE